MQEKKGQFILINWDLMSIEISIPMGYKNWKKKTYIFYLKLYKNCTKFIIMKKRSYLMYASLTGRIK